LRIFYDHQVTSLQDAGGVSRYYYELVRALLRTNEVEPEMMPGFNHSVFPFRTMGPPSRVWSYQSQLRPGYLRYFLNEALTAALTPARGEFDIYHATYQRISPFVRANAVVVTHHDSTPQRFPHLFGNADAIRKRLQKTYERADRILCISEASRADLLEFFCVDPGKTTVIHHGFTALPDVPDGSHCDLLPRQPFLLYVGARHAYKNFQLVLEALPLQPDDDLHLVAAGGGAWSAAEVSTIERLRLTERVHLLPRVTDAMLAAAYREAEMFVYPSLYEGFGFPPLEAMHAGCPAIVSAAAALPEVCGEAAFYFDPSSKEELAALIERLHSDAGLRSSKRERGYAQVRKYTWEAAAAKTLSAYRRAMET